MTVIEKINVINETIKEVFDFTQSNETVKEEVFNNALQLNCSPEVKDYLKEAYKAAYPDRVVDEDAAAVEFAEETIEASEPEESDEVVEEAAETEEYEESGDEE